MKHYNFFRISAALILVAIAMAGCNPLSSQTQVDKNFTPGFNAEAAAKAAAEAAAYAALHSPPVLTQPASQVFLLGTSVAQGAAITQIDFNNANTSSDAGMSYTCVFDRVVDGAVASGTACSSLLGTASFSASAGTLDWTPSAVAWGAYEILVTGTNAYGSSSKTVVIDVKQPYSTTNLLGYWDAGFANSSGGQGLNASLALVDLSGGGVNATIVNFAGTTSSGYDGALPNLSASEKISPNRLVFDGVDDFLDLGSSYNAQSSFYFDSWVSAANSAQASRVIAGNSDSTGKGFKLSQNLSGDGRVQLTLGDRSYADEVMADNPAVYLQFNEDAGGATVLNSANSSLNGAVYNTVTLGAAASPISDNTKSLLLAGTGGINLGNTAPIKNIFDPGNAYTIEAWVYPTSTPANWRAIFSKAFTSHATPFYQINLWQMSNNGVQASLYRSDTYAVRASVGSAANALPLNTWSHLVMTVDDSAPSLSLYLNGALVGTTSTFAGVYANSASNASIGENYNMPNTQFSFVGNIDEFAIYPTALGLTRVQKHYNARNTPTCYSRTVLANSFWYELGGLFTGGNNLKLFVNGAQECSVTSAATYAGSSNNLRVGTDSSGLNNFNGAIADFKLYSTGTAATNLANYNASKARFKDTLEYISGLKLQLAADTITGKVDGDVISTWADNSSNGNDALQATGVYQPKYYSTAGPNSKPIVRFDGNDSLYVNNFSTNAGIVGNSSYTIFIAFMQNNTLGSLSLNYSNGGFWGNGWDDNSTAISSGGPGTGVFKVLSVVKSPGNYTPNFNIYANGSNNGQVVYAGSGARYASITANAPLNIGTWWIPNDTAYSLNGDIAEILVYNTALSASDRKQIDRYLERKYGITMAK